MLADWLAIGLVALVVITVHGLVRVRARWRRAEHVGYLDHRRQHAPEYAAFLRWLRDQPTKKRRAR
jgi:hypothetical protein